MYVFSKVFKNKQTKQSLRENNRTGVDQCLWLSLIVFGYLSARFLGESLVHILREN